MIHRLSRLFVFAFFPHLPLKHIIILRPKLACLICRWPQLVRESANMFGTHCISSFHLAETWAISGMAADMKGTWTLICLMLVTEFQLCLSYSMIDEFNRRVAYMFRYNIASMDWYDHMGMSDFFFVSAREHNDRHVFLSAASGICLTKAWLQRYPRNCRLQMAINIKYSGPIIDFRIPAFL